MENMDTKICEHDEFCGGCLYQGISYEEQILKKENQVKNLIEDKGLDVLEFEKIKESPLTFNYRNKMEYTFGDLTKEGEITLGMHKKGNYMSIVTVDECQLVSEEFNEILKCTLNFVKKKGYPKYHKKSHTGLMRNLIVRKGVNTGEILVNIVTASDNSKFNEPLITEENRDIYFFDEEEFKNEIMNLGFNIVGVLRTINDNLADSVNCQELRVLHGRDYYMERILNLDFKVSAFSFFQTNIKAIENLYEEALKLPKDFENKVIYDLFSGTGTISQIMALKAKKVIAIEIVEEAVEKAKENAKINGINNCQFIAGDVFKVLDSQKLDKPDMIVVDPPRMGIEPKAMDRIIDLGVEEILYISCNPKTLVENMYYLNYFGYKVKYLRPFDNFPNTKHIECVVLMSKASD